MKWPGNMYINIQHLVARKIYKKYTTSNGQENVQKFTSSLFLREIKRGITLRFHLRSVTMTYIKYSGENIEIKKQSSLN